MADISVRITRISVYKVDLPLHEGCRFQCIILLAPVTHNFNNSMTGSYKWSGGKSVEVFDATVVRVDTNREEVFGVGENTPLGPFYLPAYPQGTRSGIEVLAPHLIGR